MKTACKAGVKVNVLFSVFVRISFIPIYIFIYLVDRQEKIVQDTIICLNLQYGQKENKISE